MTMKDGLSIVIGVMIYFIIGIMITLLMYDKLVTEITNKIKEYPLNFAGLSINQVNNLIKCLPLATVLVWPLFIVGFVQGIIKGISKILNR